MDEARERRRQIAAFETGTNIAKLREWAPRYSIDRARILFEKTGNAFHAWEAYRWARLNDQPAPDWVMHYLDDSAKALEEEKPTNAKDVAKAFGMTVRAGKSKFTLALCQSSRLALFQYCMAIKEKEPDWSVETIFGHVADNRGVSSEQVRDSYYEFKS